MKIFWFTILIFLILILHACDPYWNHTLSHESSNKYKSEYLDYGNFKIKVEVGSMANMGLSIFLGFEYENSLKYIRLNPDSLKIWVNDTLKNYFFNPEISPKNNFVDQIIYRVDLRQSILQLNDEIKIYGHNFLETTKEKYGIDTLKFIVPTDFN